MEQGGAATWAASALVSAAQTRQRCCCCWRTRAGAEGALPLLGLRSSQRRSRARRAALIGWRRTAASGATVGGGCASELRARRCYGVRLVPQLTAAAGTSGWNRFGFRQTTVTCWSGVGPRSLACDPFSPIRSWGTFAAARSDDQRRIRQSALLCSRGRQHAGGGCTVTGLSEELAGGADGLRR